MNTPVKAISDNSSYADKLIKLIPGEVVLAYLAIENFIPKDDPTAKWVEVVVSLVLLFVAIPLYLVKSMDVKRTRQVALTMGSFLVWLYTLGGPFELWAASTGVGFYVPYIGSVALVLWTTLIPHAFKTKVPQKKQAEPELA
jgi:hypothetical protein